MLVKVKKKLKIKLEGGIQEFLPDQTFQVADSTAEGLILEGFVEVAEIDTDAEALLAQLEVSEDAADVEIEVDAPKSKKSKK